MRAHKKWVIGFGAGILLSILANFWVWKAYTQDLLTDYARGGDLSRVGYIAGSGYAEKKAYRLPRKHYENFNVGNAAIDLITTGDSFSNSSGKEDQYYQDWIASLQELNVLNVQSLSGKNDIETINILLNSGYLDLVRPKFILLERIERDIVQSYSKSIDFNERMNLQDILQFYGTVSYQNNPPKIGFLNPGNLKFILYRFLYRYKDNAFFSNVHVRKLDRTLFEVPNADRLIFCAEDVSHIAFSDPDSIRKVNDNLNRLGEKLKARGIKLYFLPIVDKYNLYYDYIVGNPYPKSVFFEEIRKLDKRYVLIDTKEILSNEVKKGEKDIYYADDTHWSEKAPKKIFESVSFR